MKNQLILALTALTCFAQEASIKGTVVDSSGATVARATVKLSVDARGPSQEAATTDTGEFLFQNVPPGAYNLTFTAKGLAAKTNSGELATGQALILPNTVLSVDVVTTEMTITQNLVEIAQTQIREEEKQRLGGIIPNFFVTYNYDAAPLNVRQKFELTWKTFFDPSSFVITGIIAGVGQAQNTHKGFGQGGLGYAKRYGATYTDFVSSSILGAVVLPTVFKQDPRYFYRGTGTTKSRVLYAMSRSMVCRGDNKKDQFCYSSFLTRFGTGFMTNYFYPKVDRNSNQQIISDGFISIGGDMLGNLFQEFLAKKLTLKRH